MRRIKAIFDYCQVSGYRNIMVGNLAVPLPNPCEIKTALPNNHIGESHHAALPYQELPKFIPDLRKMSGSLSVKLSHATRAPLAALVRRSRAPCGMSSSRKCLQEQVKFRLNRRSPHSEHR